MRPNLNFHNQYEATIEPSRREKALLLFKRMSESRPGLMQEAEIKIKDSTDGRVYILINNTSAFDTKTKEIIFKFLNDLQYSKNC
jgi:hypothetical protein